MTRRCRKRATVMPMPEGRFVDGEEAGSVDDWLASFPKQLSSAKFFALGGWVTRELDFTAVKLVLVAFSPKRSSQLESSRLRLTSCRSTVSGGWLAQ